MQANPLVSVAIITYNQKEFIVEAIESTLMQDYRPIEIIVGDDCSSDGTDEILQRYQSIYPDIVKIIRSQKNIGATGNSNNVHFACTGKYVAWLGGDDLMLQGKLKKQVAFLEANPTYNLVYHNLDVFESTTNKHLFYFNNKKNCRTGNIATLIKYGSFNGACATIVKREAAPSYGYNTNLPVAADWLFWIENLADGGSVGYIDEVLGRYRRHEGNVTRKNSKGASQAYLDTLETCNIVSKKYPQYADEVKYRYSVVYRDGRKYGYIKFLLKSLQYNPLSLKTIAMLGLHLISFRKFKK
jgi:glycosyltransferase involved in cell wall biosynthesis